MRRHLAAPRLLPLTVIAMLALAGFKSVGLVRHAIAGSAPAPAPAAAAPAAPRMPVAPAATNAPAPAAGVVPPEVIVPAPRAPDVPPVTEAERALLLDLRQRRTELEGREGSLAAREAFLSAAEKRLTVRLEELSALQTRLEALEVARREHDEENWRGLVKLYETMKPREAAAIFNDLDKPVLLAVLDRMKETKAAPILAAMQPERARQATADLAQMRAQANRAPAAPRPAGG